MNIISIEKYVFFLFLVLSVFIIMNNPYNIIPFILYYALFYIPINLMVIYKKKKDKIYIPEFEFAHRIMFITIGIIPLLSPISKPIDDLLIFK